MSIFIEQAGNSFFQRPAFKFSTQEHADSLRTRGNIRISRISSFRDASLYTGKIWDSREGQVSLKKGGAEVSISVDDAYIYCATSEFLSDSLYWAISEGKDACVLITDPDALVARITNSLDGLQLINCSRCIYSGRDIDESNAMHPYVDNDHSRAIEIKPKEYADQREVRFAWEHRPSRKDLPGNITLDVIGLPLLIPIRLEGMIGMTKDEHYQVMIRIHRHDGHFGQVYFNYPRAVLSPVIYKSDGDKAILGIHSNTPTIEGGRISGFEVGMSLTRWGAIVGGMYLQSVSRIEYILVT